MSDETTALRYPLYMLYYIDDIYKEALFSEDFVKQMGADYSVEIIDGIKTGVSWALQNPDYNFSQLLPNLNHTNEDIYYFLEKYSKKIAQV